MYTHTSIHTHHTHIHIYICVCVCTLCAFLLLLFHAGPDSNTPMFYESCSLLLPMWRLPYANMTWKYVGMILGRDSQSYSYDVRKIISVELYFVLKTTVLLPSVQLCNKYIFILRIVNQVSIVTEQGKLQASTNKTWNFKRFCELHVALIKYNIVWRQYILKLRRFIKK